MEEFDIREATPKDAEKIIAYLAQVGGETDYLSFGKEGLPISIEEEEKFIQNINKEEHSVLYVVWKNGEIIGDASLSGFSRRMSHRAEFGISVVKSEWGQGIGRRRHDALPRHRGRPRKAREEGLPAGGQRRDL